MTRHLYAELSWLPRPPEDFGRQCRAATEQYDGVGARIQQLARYALGTNQLVRLAKVLDRAKEAGASVAPLIPFRLGLLANGVTDVIVRALRAGAARHGIDLECVSAGYDQIMQAALSPDSEINRSRLDAVLIAIDYRALPLPITPGDSDAARDTVARWHQALSAIRDGVRANNDVPCIFQTLAPPPEGLFGHYDRRLPGTARHVIDGINQMIVEQVAAPSDLLLDVAALAETVGLAEWHSPAQWNMAKLPFADEFVPLYTDHVARLIGALRGKSRKCLVLDLDNTLWGGVIGDDGVDGIRVAQGDPVGEAFLTVQRLALALQQRGIVLAVSSKNNDDVARMPFRQHQDMLLREEHIAVFQANWEDKARNLRAIAETLSFGLDALVLLDDNPAERALIRRELPQVAVPELPDDPALYGRTLAAAGYFEALQFSAEDRKRADFYRDNARRINLREQATDLAGYLASLQMEITFRSFDSAGRARVAQLINKSNQFNLTTRRYSEAEVAALEQDENCFTLQVRLTDTFGDNGMISVVICRRQDRETWEIDTWLMSCRVLGRGVEDAMLGELLRAARVDGVARLIGVYRPTERNGMVRDHYANLGFGEIDRRADGTTYWELATDAVARDRPIRVRREYRQLAAAPA
ncbi:MAG TPA: HAD-IIIC family phosphatase [Acetobacteraceae bacterium]|nr:HAD-IIIC family phosphatase [Acetobacteraceae bacterium]